MRDFFKRPYRKADTFAKSGEKFSEDPRFFKVRHSPSLWARGYCVLFTSARLLSWKVWINVQFELLLSNLPSQKSAFMLDVSHENFPLRNIIFIVYLIQKSSKNYSRTSLLKGRLPDKKIEEPCLESLTFYLLILCKLLSKLSTLVSYFI